MKNGTKIVLGLGIICAIYAAILNVALPEGFLKRNVSMEIYMIYLLYQMAVLPCLFFSGAYLFMNYLGSFAGTVSIEPQHKKTFYVLSLSMLAAYLILLCVWGITQGQAVLLSTLLSNNWIFILPGALLALGT